MITVDFFTEESAPSRGIFASAISNTPKHIPFLRIKKARSGAQKKLKRTPAAD